MQLYHYMLPLLVSALLLLFLNTYSYTELKTELGSRPLVLHSVFYYLQLKLAMNKEIYELAYYYNLCRVEKNPKHPSVPFQMDLTVCTVCESLNSS